MSLLAKIRQRQTPWARSILGLFVVVWLNMALQPCAMAFGNSSSGSAHCPPAHSAAVSAQHVHATDSLDPDESPCDMSASQCTFVDDLNFDGRVINIKVKDAPSDAPLGIAAPDAVIALDYSLIANSGVGDNRSVFGDPPPLNVLYCVYLI